MAARAVKSKAPRRRTASATASAKARKPARRRSPRDPKPVPVRVSPYKGDHLAGPVHAHIKFGKEEVMWRAEGGKVTIRFKHRLSPFTEWKFTIPEGCAMTSGLPVKARKLVGEWRREYLYSVVIQPKRGKPWTSDPGVIVEWEW